MINTHLALQPFILIKEMVAIPKNVCTFAPRFQTIKKRKFINNK